MKAIKLIYLSALLHIRAGITPHRVIVLLGMSLPLLVSLSCKDNNRISTNPVEFVWTFNAETEGWTGDFAEYPVGMEDEYELSFGYDSLPEPLDRNQGALKLSGINHNNDLFMFVKKRISDLEPNSVYYAKFTVEFATNEPGDELNTAEVQGGKIYVGAGAVPVEPEKVVGEDNIYGLNIGKCNENQDGEDMVVLGNLINETDELVYALKTINNQKPFHCVTNENGDLWIIIATDSGVEAATAIYINTIQVELF